MKYVFGGIRVDATRKPEITAAAAAYAEQCRAEEGCVEYTLAWSCEDENYLRLLEVWEPTSAHVVHVNQPHVQAWTQYISGAGTAAPAFTEFVVDVVR